MRYLNGGTQTKSVVKTERLSGYNRGFIPRLAGMNGPIDAMFGKNEIFSPHFLSFDI